MYCLLHYKQILLFMSDLKIYCTISGLHLQQYLLSIATKRYKIINSQIPKYLFWLVDRDVRRHTCHNWGCQMRQNKMLIEHSDYYGTVITCCLAISESCKVWVVILWACKTWCPGKISFAVSQKDFKFATVKLNPCRGICLVCKSKIWYGLVTCISICVCKLHHTIEFNIL